MNSDNNKNGFDELGDECNTIALYIIKPNEQFALQLAELNAKLIELELKDK
jgi:hypothetical protein